MKDISGKVSFTVGVKEGISLDSVKSDLEHLAQDFEWTAEIAEIGAVIGETSKTTYENVFQAQLELQTRYLKDLNPPRKQRPVSEWVELKKAQVPKGFEDRIEYIELDQQSYAF